MAAPRFLANVLGRIKMIATIATSAGAGDADKVPATGATGVLDPTILNAATTGVSKLVITLASGLLDPSIMPVGIGADTASIVSSENLSAGNVVNIYDNAGTPTVRKADATAEGKEVHGFVLAATTSPAAALVYFEGRITGLSALTIGARYYLLTTAGTVGATAPVAAGNISQLVGIAISATSISFEVEEPITIV